MKKALMVLGLLALVLTMAGPTMAAKDMKGMWGPGYFRTNAPIGIRYWVTDKMGFDIGIGFENAKNVLDKRKTGFAFDAGLPLVIAGNDMTKFFFRPGLNFVSTPSLEQTGFNPPVYEDITAKTFLISGSLGVEHFFSDKFSLSVFHGIYFSSVDSGVKNSKKVTTFATEAFGISSVGFHYYLFPSE